MNNLWLEGNLAENDPHGRGYDRPPRPNLPWIRYMSYAKIHASMIGVALGILIYFGLLVSMPGLVFAFVISVVSYALGLRQYNSNKSACGHKIGAHDLRRKPWYGFFGTVVTYILLALMFQPVVI